MKIFLHMPPHESSVFIVICDFLSECQASHYVDDDVTVI